MKPAKNSVARNKSKGSAASASLIRRQLSSQNYNRKILAIANMGKKGKIQWLPYLRRFARDKKYPEVRGRAVWSVGAIGSRLGLPIAIKALKDPDEHVRRAAENATRAILKLQKK